VPVFGFGGRVPVGVVLDELLDEPGVRSSNESNALAS
jgi:hypothetical protein